MEEISTKLRKKLDVPDLGAKEDIMLDHIGMKPLIYSLFSSDINFGLTISSYSRMPI